MVPNYFLYPCNVLSCISERFCLNFEDLLQVLLGKPASVVVIVLSIMACFMAFLLFSLFILVNTCGVQNFILCLSINSKTAFIFERDLLQVSSLSQAMTLSRSKKNCNKLSSVAALLLTP